MTKHTPGPWDVPFDPTGKLWVYADGVLVAKVKTHDEDARLIAAAPELLAAALAIQAADVTSEEIEHARDLVDAAIRRASGDSTARTI